MSENEGRDGSASNVIYKIEDRPEPPRAIVLALQHVLTMFGATVSVPLLFQTPLEMDGGSLAILVSSVMFCSGVATVLQTRFGSRLPIVQGVSFSFLAAFFACIGYAKANPVPGISHGALSMQYIAGSILVGSVVEAAVGFTGLMGKLRRVVTPVTIGPVIMLIGLALFQHGWPKAGEYWPIGGLTIVLVAVFSLILARKNQLFRTLPVLLAIVGVWIVCLFCTLLELFPEGHKAAISFAALSDTPWVRFNLFWGERPVVFPWGLPKFQIGLIVATLAGFLASMIESFGDYHGAAAMAKAPPPDDKQISRGIGFEGVGCFITSLLGGFSSTSYSENIALIGITRVASRYVVMIAGFVLIVLGFFTKLGAVVATIPSPVVGGLYCALFGLIAAVGMQQLSKADLYSQRTLFIAGFILFMGLSVPAWMQDDGFGGVSKLYLSGKTMINSALPAWLASIVVSIGSTGMGVAAILGILLDNLIPGTDKERGIAAAPDAKA